MNTIKYVLDIFIYYILHFVSQHYTFSLSLPLGLKRLNTGFHLNFLINSLERGGKGNVLILLQQGGSVSTESFLKTTRIGVSTFFSSKLLSGKSKDRDMLMLLFGTTILICKNKKESVAIVGTVTAWQDSSLLLILGSMSLFD